jgi:molecular chaperone HtpG
MKNYKPHIGKNVIETLTLGMYEDARFIYREYVQNAADQIDVAVEEGVLNRKNDGEINITIDKIHKLISIKDNATGIKSSEVLQFLGDVANSQKDRTKRKGFRGIGRLGGLGYCEKLIFETSYKGENVKSIITLNAKQLKRIIEDRTITMDAATVISVITTFDKIEADMDEHFFKVELRNVTNEELLDEGNIRNYLSMVAPIPFNKEFPFWKKIHTRFNENNITIEEYDVHLNINEEKLYKAYKTDIFSKNNEPVSKILDIAFIEIKNEENELIALGWYGVSDLLNKIIYSNNIERGFRIRKDNIQIGSEDTLNRFFSEDRFNHHFIGEIYVLGSSFIPNARRDYFNENKTVQTFETKLEIEFNALYRFSHISSEIHNRFKEITSYKEKEREFSEKEFRSKNEENHYREQLSISKGKAIKAENKLVKIFEKSLDNRAIAVVYNHVVREYDISVENHGSSHPIERHYYELSLSRLTDKEKVIVKEIFSIIEQNLSLEKAEMLKKKIAEHYN